MSCAEEATESAEEAAESAEEAVESAEEAAESAEEGAEEEDVPGEEVAEAGGEDEAVDWTLNRSIFTFTIINRSIFTFTIINKYLIIVFILFTHPLYAIFNPCIYLTTILYLSHDYIPFYTPHCILYSSLYVFSVI